MMPLEVIIYILGPIGVAVGIYALFLKRELNDLEARRRESHTPD